MKKALASLLGFLCSASMVIADSGFNYVKVKSAPEKWDGEYLIVCESQNVAFDGSLETLDVQKKGKSVTIENETIYVDKNKGIENSQFTIASISGGYSIKSASGYYIANSGTKNGLTQSESELKNKIELSNGAFTITSLASNKETYLRFNKTASEMRFRYFTSKTSQEPITLYKKVESNVAPDTRTAVDIATFKTKDNSDTLGIYKSIGTVVTASPTGWTPAEENVPYTYSSSATSIADIDANGVIYAKKVGKATITAKANVANNDTTYKIGATKSFEIVVADNRKVVNLTEFKATNDTLLVGNYTTTTVSNDQPEWTPNYTYESKRTTVAEVNTDGVVTAKALGTAKIVVTAKIETDNPDFKLGTKTKEITITVKKPSHKATFMVNGEESSYDFEEGESITFPTPDESQLAGNLVFTGWSTSNLDSMVYNAPELVDTKTAVMGNTDLTFYAVFARIAQTGTSESDVLTTEMISQKLNKEKHAYGTEVTYQNDSVKWFTDSYIDKAGDNYLQINSGKGDAEKGSYVGFETPYSIKTIKFELTSSTSITIYVKEEPTFYPKSGTNVKSFSLSSANSGEISIDGDYTKLYLQSSGSIKFTSVTLIGNVIEPSYAGYVTDSVAAKTSRTYDVTVSACGYTTVCLPYNAVAPAEATLYALKSVDSEGLHFASTETLVAGQGYVLHGEAGAQYTLKEVTEAVEYNANMLKGVVEQTNCVDLQLQGSRDYAYPWILAKDGTFKRYTGAYIPAGKAYLDGALLQDLQANHASALRVILEEDEVTALSQLHEEKATAPCYYNLQGQRVAQPRQAGALYIESNGRKIIVK